MRHPCLRVLREVHKGKLFAAPRIDHHGTVNRTQEAAFVYPWLDPMRLSQPRALLPEDILFYTGGWWRADIIRESEAVTLVMHHHLTGCLFSYCAWDHGMQPRFGGSWRQKGGLTAGSRHITPPSLYPTKCHQGRVSTKTCAHPSWLHGIPCSLCLYVGCHAAFL